LSNSNSGISASDGPTAMRWVGSFGSRSPVVDRSTTGSTSDNPGGQSVDVGGARWAAVDALDELKHLAKVRVAGSNPVFRSIRAGQGRCFDLDAVCLLSRVLTRSRLVHASDEVRRTDRDGRQRPIPMSSSRSSSLFRRSRSVDTSRSVVRQCSIVRTNPSYPSSEISNSSRGSRSNRESMFLNT
jgi:hypothetical protein